MRNRSRVTSFAWTRRVHDVPAVVGYLPALAGETLEDRTLLSGVTDSSNEESSWADLLSSETSLSFLVPSDAVLGWLAMDSEQVLPPLIGNSLPENVAFPTIQFRVDGQSQWGEVVNLFGRGQVLALSGMTLDGAARLVRITVQFVDPMDRISDAATSGESRFGLASGPELDQPDLSLPISNPLATAIYSIGRPNIAAVGEVSGPSLRTTAVAGWERGLPSAESFAISAMERVDPPASEFDDLDAVADLKRSSLGSATPPVTLLAIFSSATEASVVPYAQVSGEPAAVLFEPAVLKSFNGVSESAAAFESAAIVLSPADGLQAAAAPLMAVVETVLASLDTVAHSLLALFTGSGGGTSPIAPVVEPIVSSSPVIIDPKRPGWALHDGVLEELAAYSLVIAPDQHFDLKEFGPASSAADPVIRIEFVVPPQHGQVSATANPGSFQYTADPGFSGADTARFRVTRASGQTVAGAVTFLVSDRDFMERPQAPVRQVELPILDQRLSDLAPSAIDASFGLSDGGMDLP
ncbi:MAG: Ig-like domain-containing protein [Planctomycetaceae bacterium]